MTIQLNNPKLTILLLGTLLLSGCGGESSSSSDAAPPANNTELPIGIFPLDYGLFTGVYTFLDNGEFYGIHYVNSGSVLAGHPRGSLSDNNSFSNLESIHWANFIDDARQLGAQEPNGQFGRSYDGTRLSASIRGSMGSFTADTTGQLTYSGSDTRELYSNPLLLEDLMGSYSGIVRTVGLNRIIENINSFTIDQNGSLSVAAVDCEFSGMITQYQNTGVYNAELNVSGADCEFNSTPLLGILTPLEVSDGQIEIAIQVNSFDETQTAVFILNK